MNITDDPILQSLLNRYFDVASKENYPNTPKLTEEADKLQKIIRELKAAQQTTTN